MRLRALSLGPIICEQIDEFPYVLSSSLGLDYLGQVWFLLSCAGFSMVLVGFCQVLFEAVPKNISCTLMVFVRFRSLSCVIVSLGFWGL